MPKTAFGPDFDAWADSLLAQPDYAGYTKPELRSAWANHYGLPDAAAAPAKEPGLASDAKNLLGLGMDEMAGGLRWATGKVFGDDAVSAIDRLGGTSGEQMEAVKQQRVQALSPAMRSAREKEFVTEDEEGNYGWGPAWADPRSYVAAIVQSVPGTVATMGPGMFIGKMAAAKTFERAVASGASKEAATALANKTFERAASVAGGMLEGGQQGASTGAEVERTIMGMRPEVLGESEFFRDLLASGMDEAQARRELASNAGVRAALMAGVTTGIFGGQGDKVLARALGRGLQGGIMRRAGKVGAGEAFEEFGQGYTSKVAENLGLQQADPTIPTTKGALNEAVAGTVAGFGMGGVMGTVARPSTPEKAKRDDELAQQAQQQIEGAQRAQQIIAADAQAAQQTEAKVQAITAAQTVDEVIAAATGQPAVFRGADIPAGVQAPASSIAQPLGGDIETPAFARAGRTIEGVRPLNVVQDAAQPATAGRDVVQNAPQGSVPERAGQVFLQQLDRISPRAAEALIAASARITGAQDLPTLAAALSQRFTDRAFWGELSQAVGRDAPTVATAAYQAMQFAAREAPELQASLIHIKDVAQAMPGPPSPAAPTGSLSDVPFAGQEQAQQAARTLGRSDATQAVEGPAGARLQPADVAGDAKAVEALKASITSDAVTDNGSLSAEIAKNKEGLDSLRAVSDANLPGIALARWAAQKMGRRVVVVDSDHATAPFNGANVSLETLGGVGDILFIHAKTKRPALAVVGHELLHTLSPELRARLTKALMSMIGEKAIEAKMALGMNREAAIEEVLADIVGNRFTEASFWKMLERKDAGLFREFAQRAIEVIGRILEAMKSGLGLFGADEGLSSSALRRARMTIATAIAEHARSLTPQEQKQLGWNGQGSFASNNVAIAIGGRDEPPAKVIGRAEVDVPKAPEPKRLTFEEGLRANSPIAMKQKVEDEKAAKVAGRAPIDVGEVNTDPTDGQKEAGNYKKGHISFEGLDISIENPTGSERSGKDTSGKPWTVTMSANYGYVKRTEGADGDQIDVYLVDRPAEGAPVFVFDQYHRGRFDEAKVVLGVATRREAEATYDAHFSDGSGPKRRLGMRQMSMDEFKAWLKNGDTTKPVAKKGSVFYSNEGVSNEDDQENAQQEGNGGARQAAAQGRRVEKENAQGNAQPDAARDGQEKDDDAGDVAEPRTRADNAPMASRKDVVGNNEGGRSADDKKPGAGKGIELVPVDSFGWYEEDDTYVYHVTSEPTAAKILSKGFSGTGKRTFTAGVYPAYSKGKLFFTDRSGVKYWMGRVEDQLFDQHDDPPEVAVVRIPKAKLEGLLQADQMGTDDAKHPSWYVNAKDMPNESPAPNSDGAPKEGEPVEPSTRFSIDSKELQKLGPLGVSLLKNPKGWAILTAENPNAKKASAEANAKAMAKLKADLEARGLKYIAVQGKYGSEENSLLVVGEIDPVELAKAYDQESVLMPQGLVYQDGSVQPSKGITFFDDKPEDFYTEIPKGIYFASDIDWDAPRKQAGGVQFSGESKTGVDLTHAQRRATLEQDLYREGFALEEALPKFANQAEFGQFLSDRLGRDTFAGNYSVNAEKHVAGLLAHEGILALGARKNAGSWYRDSIEGAMAQAAILYPEIAASAEARFIFSAALAITSNGQTIEENVRLAFEAYDAYDKDGKFSRSVEGAGDRTGVINKSLRRFNEMVERAGSVKTLRNFMLTRRPVREIEDSLGVKITGENRDTLVYGGAVFGPKVGGGFLPNLNGHWDALTIDRWLARTYNRLTGNMLNASGEMQNGPRNGAEREFLRRAFDRAVKTMSDLGHAVQQADLQALLWYPEKELYAKYGVSDARAAPTDYQIEVTNYVESHKKRRGISTARQKPGGRRAAGDDAARQVALFSAEPGPGRVGAADAPYSRREAVAGAVSVEAVHWGKKEGLSWLSGTAYGSGLKGAERERLARTTDARIKRRVYFYVARKDGTLPLRESGVGPFKYTARLGNLYDSNTGSSKISATTANEFESAVLDAGYDGYIAPDMGMAVVLDSDVPVTSHGMAADEGVIREAPKGNVKIALLASEIRRIDTLMPAIRQYDPEAKVIAGSLSVKDEAAPKVRRLLGVPAVASPKFSAEFDFGVDDYDVADPYVLDLTQNDDLRGPKIAPEKADRYAAQRWLKMAEDKAMFAYPVSDQETLENIAFDLAKLKATPWRPADPIERVDGATRAAKIRLPARDGESAHATVLRDGKKRVWVNLVLSRKGAKEGSAVYAIVANFAHNNGLKFIGDPAGLSDDALFRRTENMLASALKFGTTDHLSPHQRQLDAGLAWREGDTEYNIAAMLAWSREKVMQAVPALYELSYDPSTGDILDAEGKTVDTQAMRAILDIKDAGREARAGSRTAARTVATNEFVAEYERGERDATGELPEGMRGVSYSSEAWPDLVEAYRRYNEEMGEDWRDLLSSVESLAEDGRAPAELQPAVEKAYQELADDRDMGGRGDLDSAEAEFVAAVEKALGGNATSYSREPAWVAAGSADLRSAASKIDTYAPEVPIKDKVKALSINWKQRLLQGLADSFAPLKDLDRDAYIAARMTKSADGVLEGLLLYGKPVMDADGSISGDLDHKGFLGVMRELNGEHDRWFMWVAGNRSERLKAEGRENLFTDPEIEAMKQLNRGAMADGSSREAAYTRALAGYVEYSKSVLDILEKTGVIDAEGRKLWEHDFYVPYYRMKSLDDGSIAGPGKIKGLVRQQAIKKLKGGKENLGDLMENTLRNWSHLLGAALANQAAVKSLHAAVDAGIAIDAPSEYAGKEIASAVDRKNGLVYAMEGGMQRWYVVDDPYVLEAITSLEAVPMNGPAMQLMSKAKHYLTLGVTIAPAFKIRNLLRDTVAAIGQNDMSYNMAANVMQGWAGTHKGADDYAQMLFGGALMRFGQLTDGRHAEHVKRLINSGVDDKTILDSENKIAAAFSKGWDWWQDFGDRMENINRAALYKQLIAKGVSPREAAFQARDMMDFSLQGSWAGMRMMTQISPFLNARVQGLYKLGRAAKEDPKRVAYVVGGVAMASIALLLAYQDDEDWRAREDWDRDNFWWIKIGGVAYRIPKPFEIGALGTIAERSLEYFISDEMTGARFAERMRDIVTQQFEMNPVPQLFKPMIDIYANQDSFTGRQIETRGMEKLSKAERANPHTTALARALGQAAPATGLSPVQIDHLVRAYTGWLGAQALNVVDAMVSPFGQVERPAPKWDDYTGGMIKGLPTSSSRYLEEFYKTSKAIHEVMGDIKLAREMGELERAKEIETSEAWKVQSSKLYQRAEREMSKLNTEMRKTRNSPTLDAQAKRDRLEQLTLKKNALAKMISERTLKSRLRE